MRRMTANTGPLTATTLDAIGHTPLIELRRIPEGRGRILAKAEFLNPGGSKKDRIAAQIIREAETEERLHPGQPVVELTSGNTGAGLALVCSATGHPFTAVMSRGNSGERAQMMRALGAEVVLIDQSLTSQPGRVSGDDLDEVEHEAQRLCTERGAFRADQFTLPGNYRAHYMGTALEIVSQAERFDAFCDFVGTGGSFAGCAKRFKEEDDTIGCYVVEPSSSPALAGLPILDPRHRIQGGGYSRRHLPMLDLASVVPDGYLTVTDEEAMGYARRLAREEGLFTGISSGANVAAAMKLLDGPYAGGTVVVLLNDTGLKYLSTELCPRGEWLALSSGPDLARYPFVSDGSTAVA